MLRPGVTIGGLCIENLLGRGGMGEVYRAVQLSLGRPVAIKRIASTLMYDEGVIERFRREAHMIARVNHPNILAVYDFNSYRDDEDDEHLILVMELVEGGCSGKHLLRSKPSWQEATAIIQMIAEGLLAVNELGIIHRDIKPDNIMLTRNGVAKLCDFGLAKAADSQTLTLSGSLLGTPAYLPPEVCNGDPCDHRGDIYSLGATWYHLLCGTPPFEARSTIEMIRAHVERPVPDLRSHCSECPAALAALVADCLAKEPQQRPDVSQLLERISSSLPAAHTLPRTVAGLVHRCNPGLAETVSPLAATPRTSLLDETRRNTASPPASTLSQEPRRSPLLLILVLAALILGALLLTLLVLNRTEETAPALQSAEGHRTALAEVQHSSPPHESSGQNPSATEGNQQTTATASVTTQGAWSESDQLAISLAEMDLERGRPLAAWQRVRHLQEAAEAANAASYQQPLREILQRVREQAEPQRAMVYLEIYHSIERADFASAKRLLEEHARPYAELFGEYEEYQSLYRRLDERARTEHP